MAEKVPLGTGLAAKGRDTIVKGKKRREDALAAIMGQNPLSIPAKPSKPKPKKK